MDFYIILDDVRIFLWTCGHMDLYGLLIFEKTDFYHYHLATLIEPPQEKKIC